jgi:eukaryotic-like serine/threonine-protein kinase
MLTGISPFKADTAMAMMFKRTQERATPLSQMNIGAPSAISDIVAKCLEIKPDERYQTARDVINDLEAWKGGAPRSIIAPPTRHVRYGSLYEKLLAGAAAVVLGLIAFSFRDKFISHSTPKGAVVAQPISLAILPFHNASTDVSLDWLGPSLADMLNEEVGNSQRLHAVSSSRIHQILKDLHQPANAEFDSDILRNIAQNCSADILVWGRYAKFGDTIRVDASVQDLKTGSTKPVKIEIPSEKDIPKSVPQLAELIRNNLSVSEDVAKELKASSFRPSSQSVAALRDYDQGLQLIRDGKNLEAVKSLQSAIKEDPQFALAYSRLAATDAELGYDSDAEQNSRKAVELSQQLPLAEKYLIEANHARLMKDNKKAIEAYENLAKTFPGDADVEYDLGNLYKDSGEYDKAKAQFDKILSADPKNAKVLWQAGVVQIMKDNPQGAIDPLTQGHSAAVQLDNQEQNALILQALGVSYRLLNKPQEAMNNYQQSLEISRRLGLKRMQASSLSEMAQVQSTLGKPKEALASYNQALQLLHEIGMNKEIGDTLINRGVFYQSAGDYDKALQDFKESYQIQRDAGDENYQALCLSNIGSVYLAKGDADNALIYLQQALQLRQKLNDPEYVAETWGAMGDVYMSTGDYDKAVTAMMTALDLYHKSNDVRGWSAESRQMGTTLLAQGRMAAALSALQDSVKGYQSIGTRSREMVDAQRDLADALALAGRGDESSKPLQDAQDLARELNSPGVQSAISGAQGDVQFYGGNLKAARPAYEQALKAASQGKDKEQLLTAKLNLARLTIAEGRAPAAIPDLRAIVQQADSLNLKYLSLQGSVAMAEAMINTKDYARARQELERQLSKSEKLGSRLETARIHYLLGNAMRLGGSTSEAASQYQQALRLFDDMKKEPGAEKLLNRADLRPMYDDSTHWVSTLRG